MKTKTGRH